MAFLLDRKTGAYLSILKQSVIFICHMKLPLTSPKLSQFWVLGASCRRIYRFISKRYIRRCQNAWLWWKRIRLSRFSLSDSLRLYAFSFVFLWIRYYIQLWKKWSVIWKKFLRFSATPSAKAGSKKAACYQKQSDLAFCVFMQLWQETMVRRECSGSFAII